MTGRQTALGVLLAALGAASPALAHGESPAGAASVDALVALALLASAILYGAGARRHRLPAWRYWAFAAGWTTLAASLAPPLDRLADASFSMHMIQHQLLMQLAAPLMVLGRPLVVGLQALPARLRRRAGRKVMRWAAIRPATAFLIHGALIWLWHVPALFNAAAADPFLHALQHLCFFGSAAMFWWALLARRAEGRAVFYLFLTLLHTGALGALLTFSRVPWYELAGTLPFGLTALGDQQLGGLVMWVPGGVAYLGAALALSAEWLARSEAPRQAGP